MVNDSTVGHMEEMLQSDPDHGHALMVTLLSASFSLLPKLCEMHVDPGMVESLGAKKDSLYIMG